MAKLASKMVHISVLMFEPERSDDGRVPGLWITLVVVTNQFESLQRVDISSGKDS